MVYYIILQIIMMIMRQLLRQHFSTHKPEGKTSRSFMGETLHHNMKNYQPIPDMSGARKINIEKLSIDHLKDTNELSSLVCKLEHGLDKYLQGQLVFGDKGVGVLPQQSQNTPNQMIEQLSGYVKPSEDKALLGKTTEANCRYLSSTSCISTPLIVLYYIFSCFRYPQSENIFSGEIKKPMNWMVSYRKPITFYLKPLGNDRQAIVSDHGIMPMSNEVLMNLGHIIEYFLTHKKQDTTKLMSGQYAHNAKNYYRYAKVNNDLMLRSQIDCMSYNEKGDPYVFEIKSRACAPIRYDIQNYKKYKDYDIDCKRGLYESFERQYFDLIRGGFLKYVMQVKIGRMDGAFIAYHNTQKIYGYEYVKLKQMALRVFGDEYNLDVSFLSISKMLTLVLDDIRDQFSEYKQNQLKIGFYADQRMKKLIVMVEPMVVTKEYVPLKKEEKVKDIFDYFKNYKPLKNPYFKVQYSFFWFINGVHIRTSQILLTPYDSLDLRFKPGKKKFISENQYLNFLREAYKQQENFSELLYHGHWGKYVSDQ